MSVNIGTLDRTLRTILGIALLGAPFVSGLAVFEAGWAFGLSIALGLIMLGTAATRFCPLYTLLGVKTCKVG